MEDNRKGGEARNQDKTRDEQMAQNRTGMPDEPKAKRQQLDKNIVTLAEDSDGDRQAKEENGQLATTTTSTEKEAVWMSIWVWVAVLNFISRMEMADRVSLVCHGLKKLCWPRLHGEQVASHWVEELDFREGKRDEKGQTKADLILGGRHGKNIPIATGSPPPDYIQGFKHITIRYADAEVFQFLRNIRPKLASIHLFLNLGKSYTLHNIQNLLGALNGCSISFLYIGYAYASVSVSKLRQAFPGLMEKIPAISIELHYIEDCLELNELLLAKIEGGKPFVMKIQNWRGDHPIPIGAIKEAFQAASKPQSFYVTIFYGPKLEVFRMENEKTGEVLAMEFIGYSCYELYRCPRGEVQQWRKEAEKFTEKQEGTTRIYIYF